MKNLLMLLIVLIAPTAAVNASTVILSGSSPITIRDQIFIFDNVGVPLAMSGPAFFTIKARGDYSVGDFNEFVNWNLDGIVSENGWRPDSAQTVTVFAGNDVLWEQTRTLSDGIMNSLTSDGNITVTLTNSFAVTPLMNPTDFVSFKLIYEDSIPTVPVPAAVWLFGSGLLGLIGIARRKKAA